MSARDQKTFAKNIFLFSFLAFMLTVPFMSCQKDRYRTDRKNKMTRKAKVASDYLANQAIDLTQDNIEKRGKAEKKSRKELVKKQKELNEANETTSKIKKPKKHSGNYKFY